MVALPRKGEFIANSLATVAADTVPDGRCPMCLQDFTDPVQTPCKHVACRECLTSWFGRGNKCLGCNVALFRIPPKLPDFVEEIEFPIDVDQEVVIEACNAYIKLLEDENDFSFGPRCAVNVDIARLLPAALGAIIFEKPDLEYAISRRDASHVCLAKLTPEEVCAELSGYDLGLSSKKC